MRLPLEVSKLVYSGLEGVELFFQKIHGKGANHMQYFQRRSRLKLATQSGCGILNLFLEWLYNFENKIGCYFGTGPFKGASVADSDVGALSKKRESRIINLKTIAF